MFRIKKLQLWKNEEIKEYNLEKSTYIYGSNSVGKTLFAEALNYVLGASSSSKDEDLFLKDGMNNITDIGAHLVNGQSELWIKRRKKSCFYYKRSIQDQYSQVSKQNYIKKIEELISASDSESQQKKVYKSVFEEEPTFRSFAFLNFITESHQGDLNQIFTKGNEVKNAVRIKKIMTFFFNYKNVEEIYEEKKKLVKIQDDIDSLLRRKDKYLYLRNNLKFGFQKLGLNFTGKSEEDRKTISEFRRTYKRQDSKASGDLIYLSRASLSLAEEIKQYSFLSNQSKRAKNRKQNEEALLKLLETLSLEDATNSKYLSPVQKAIKRIHNERELLSVSSYDKAIAKIKEEKIKIDSQIEEIKSQAWELSFDEAEKQIIIINKLLSDFEDFTENAKLNKLEDNKKKIKRHLNDLQDEFNDDNIQKFNNDLLELYFDKNVSRNVNYVQSDKEEDGFNFNFHPLTQHLLVEKIELKEPLKHTDKDEKIKILFVPGSLARRTHIQILVYLLMLEYVKNNFNQMKILPILVIDSADQAFQPNNFEFLYTEMIRFAKKIGIQLIFISKDLPNGNNYVVDISNGFNPFYKD